MLDLTNVGVVERGILPALLPGVGEPAFEWVACERNLDTVATLARVVGFLFSPFLGCYLYGFVGH